MNSQLERLWSAFRASEIDKTSDIAILRDQLGGVGEVVPLPLIEELWEEYSGSMDAYWMSVNREALGNFTGWLVHTLLWERGKRERGA